jgi:hypothetical protein
MDYTALKTVIQYLYLDDTGFLREKKNLNQLFEYFKIARLFKLKSLQTEIESKMRTGLSKFNQAFQHMSLFDDESESQEDFNIIDNEGSGNQFKGLFFLPNGNAMILLDEELIDKVLGNSVTINFGGSNQLVNPQTIVNNSPRLNKPISQNRTNLSISKTSRSSNCKKTIIEDDEFLKDTTKPLRNALGSASCNEIFESIKAGDCLDIYDYFRKNNLIDEDVSLLENDLLRVFNKKETSDITIRVGDFMFHSHKLILIARSKFFEIMLSENMKENTTGEVSISNCTPEEFLLFLIAIYTDNLLIDIDKALDLMKVNKI